MTIMIPAKSRRINKSRLARNATIVFWTLLVLNGMGPEVVYPAPQPPKRQVDEYNARVPKTVIELQQFRESASIGIRKSTGQKGTATLINLNPQINTWFLLLIQWNDGQPAEAYHLENALPATQKLFLDPGYPEGIVLVSQKDIQHCALWSVPTVSELAKAVGSGKTHAPLCDKRLFLRNKTIGHKTTLEQVTDLLRTHVWQGEKITAFVRETFYQDAYLNTSVVVEANNPSAGTRPRAAGAPARPLINPRHSNNFLIPQELGIDLECDTGNNVLVGRWYRARELPGVFVSVIQPNLIAEEVITNQTKKVNPLDEVEDSALVYMVAFDLNLFDLGFEMGTEHPNVNWSDRVA